eukprot:m.101829 g.101829  ORF g.101829 m.101829 type:complete len:783 (-) comp15670_c0_seq2:1623-3971(-)
MMMMAMQPARLPARLYASSTAQQQQFGDPSYTYNATWGQEAASGKQASPRVVNYHNLRASQKDLWKDLPESVQYTQFLKSLESGSCEALCKQSLSDSGISPATFLTVLDAGMATFLLHVESRISSALGEGFYTIGPCGEELQGIWGALLRPTDAVALHYRHLATQIVRQLLAGRTMEDILLDRARGHTVARSDPVTGGVHCALGGGEHDFLVTSTLASQAPPAVGRALGNTLAHFLKQPSHFPRDFVSFVSVGDGSVNNAHFLSALNMAKYASYRGVRCPVVFAITDNNLSISLKGQGWLANGFSKALGMPLFEADGRSPVDLWTVSRDAIATARRQARPVTLLVSNLPRRFGHAATDRQNAYLEDAEIERMASTNYLAGACAQAVANGVTTYEQLTTRFRELSAKVEEAFHLAVQEPKLTSRLEALQQSQKPLAPLPANVRVEVTPPTNKKRTSVMRKNMNTVIEEIMTKNSDVVYIGEDVEHGGYYLVTEDLAKKFPFRVRDFPPDETSLVGAAMGYTQAGLLPILEIPYAKYLDCAADMFYEACLMNWLSNGKQGNGMIVRLQGFDRGIFGGNFHTHNILSMPPGLDVVCYSNGYDYARGWRYMLRQARAGRMVMSVDSTNLLNLRHLHEADDAWRRPYPEDDEELPFDAVTTYGSGKNLTIAAYGNTVVMGLKAMKLLQDVHGISDVRLVDSPYLSGVSAGLRAAVRESKHVVFADPCKQGQQPFAGIIAQLQREDALPAKWQCVAAQPTYNPLGSTITFTSEHDIVEACLKVLKKKK